MSTRKPRRTPASDLLASVHQSAAAMFEAGAIGKTTMREYEKLCLAPVGEFTPEEIAGVRKGAAVSQPVFAAYLNVAKSTVSQWERGEKKPDGPARKLLDLVRRKGLHVLA